MAIKNILKIEILSIFDIIISGLPENLRTKLFSPRKHIL